MIDKIYLDNNSTTFCNPQVIEAISDYLQSHAGNPSNVHAFGQKAKGIFLGSQKKIGAFIGCKPANIVFTSGGTEALNYCIRGICHSEAKGHILSTNGEHAAVDEVLNQLSATGWEVEKLPIGTYGAITPEAIENAIKSTTQLITVIAANNETGVLTDVESIANIAEKRGIPVLFDGVAWLGKNPIPSLPGKVFWCFSGHKIGAPAGIGLAVLPAGSKIAPLIVGGPQQLGRRAGSENMIGIVGLAKAIESISGQFDEDSARMQALRELLEISLQNALPNVFINGDGTRICNTVNFYFAGVDGETLLYLLDQNGVAASMGSACSAGTLQPSRVLSNMGYDRARVLSSLRFSLSRHTTEQEIRQVSEIIIRLVKKQRESLKKA